MLFFTFYNNVMRNLGMLILVWIEGYFILMPRCTLGGSTTSGRHFTGTAGLYRTARSKGTNSPESGIPIKKKLFERMMVPVFELQAELLANAHANSYKVSRVQFNFCDLCYHFIKFGLLCFCVYHSFRDKNSLTLTAFCCSKYTELNSWLCASHVNNLQLRAILNWGSV